MSTSKKRASLNIRLQPNPDSIVGKVVDYLDKLEPRQRNRYIAEILTIFLLPYVQGEKVTKKELNRIVNNCTDACDKHFHTIRQTFGLESSNSQLHEIIAGLATVGAINNKSSSSLNHQQINDDDDDYKSIKPVLGGDNDSSTMLSLFDD